MNKWQRREQELPETIRVWLYGLLDLSDGEIRIQIAIYLVEHNANLMESLERARHRASKGRSYKHNEGSSKGFHASG